MIEAEAMGTDFRQLDYQERVLSILKHYLDTLKDKKGQADQVAAIATQNPALDLPVPDFARQAWEALGAAGKLSPPHTASGTGAWAVDAATAKLPGSKNTHRGRA